MVLLRWLSSWFLINKETFKLHQKGTLDLAIVKHSRCLKALHDIGCLRLKQVLGREFKATSPPPDFLPHPSLASAWGECFYWPMGLKHRIWHDKLKADMTSALTLEPQDWRTVPRFFSTPLRDWYGSPFPTHGKLAQGLHLTMRSTRTASPLCLFSPQWPETWLSSGSCANIWAVLTYVFKNSATHNIYDYGTFLHIDLVLANF